MSEGIQWDAYSRSYDVLPEIFPAYQENIDHFCSSVRARFSPADSFRLLDLGAGTGNYLAAVSAQFPNAQFVHVDSSAAMNEIARAKYESAGFDIEIRECPIEDVRFKTDSFDVIVCVNVLYALSDRQRLLGEFRSWLKDGGMFYAIDFGREQNAVDWGLNAIGNTLFGKTKMRTLAKYLGASREVARQASVGRKSQVDGTYWMHDLVEFKQEIESAGFVVEVAETCYRDYCDRVVGSKRAI